MPTSVETPVPQWEPLDEALWRAWVAKGHAQEKRSSTKFLNTMTWIVVTLLLTVLAVSSYLAK